VIEPAVMDFYRVEGDEIHEVAVGPVHAGVIEPGHFRFQCHGEKVFHLEISLGFQHRGVERSLINSPDKKRLFQIQTLSGDTTAGHTIAYCQAIEALSGCKVSPRCIALRRVALELERLACHTGDLGALAGDVGFLPTLSFCGRIRGDFLNATALICGNRFSRNLLLPGGVRYDLDKERCDLLRSNLEKIGSDAIHATSMLWDTPSVMDRFERTGTVSKALATSIGLVGVAARACGLQRDIRTEFPLDDSSANTMPISVESSGDVYARARVRFRELETSLAFLQDQLKALPEGDLYEKPNELAADALAVSLTEGWRGEICHVAITDQTGKLIRYKVVDSSFHNWTGLAMALRNQEISDFPLCNKSFNLSYCGHDL
jgi:Ni,Fe-hydrogenase III large subunit